MKITFQNHIINSYEREAANKENGRQDRQTEDNCKETQREKDTEKVTHELIKQEVAK